MLAAMDALLAGAVVVTSITVRLLPPLVPVLLLLLPGVTVDTDELGGPAAACVPGTMISTVPGGSLGAPGLIEYAGGLTGAAEAGAGAAGVTGAGVVMVTVLLVLPETAGVCFGGAFTPVVKSRMVPAGSAGLPEL
jgi:hypothetical protein